MLSKITTLASTHPRYKYASNGVAVSFCVYGCGKPWIARDFQSTLFFYP